MDIKPIETNYKGYRFRSRLEARWAVFFDALGVKWEYEKEGFELPSGNYLPDFWIPEWKVWVEIKPEDGATEKALKLAEELCMSTGFAVLVTDGLPKWQMQGHIYFKGFRSFYFKNCRTTKWEQAIRIYRDELLLERLKIEYPECEFCSLKDRIKSDIEIYSESFGKLDTIHTDFTFLEGRDYDSDIVCLIGYRYLSIMYRPICDDDFGDEVQCGIYDGFARYNLWKPFVFSDVSRRYKFIDDEEDWEDGIVGKAVAKAKSARFEHGECG